MQPHSWLFHRVEVSSLWYPVSDLPGRIWIKYFCQRSSSSSLPIWFREQISICWCLVTNRSLTVIVLSLLTSSQSILPKTTSHEGKMTSQRWSKSDLGPVLRSQQLKPFSMFCFGATQGCPHRFFLTLCSGITSGRLKECWRWNLGWLHTRQMDYGSSP